MKKLIPILVLSILGTTFSSAQIKNDKLKNPSQVQIDPALLDGNLNLETVKKHIKSGKLCYTVSTSMTAIFPPKNPKPVKAVDAHYNSKRYVIVEREYLRTNGQIRRSDNNFNSNSGNYFEVLIYPQRRDSKKVDENQVKLTWRIPESRLRTFHLQNVSVRYKPHGILITGDYEVDGIIFGVSIALIPNGCII